MEYEKCLVEVDEVLNHLSKEDLNKIPEDILKGIKEHRDKEYIWKYDESKELKEQKFDRNTIAVLSYINMEYLLSKEQKELMEKIHELNEQNLQNDIQKEYDPKELFKNKKNNTVQSEREIAKLEENKWYNKLFSFIKRMFKIKNKRWRGV